MPLLGCRIDGVHDELLFRDPRGLGPRPSLEPFGGGLWVTGPFLIRHRFTIDHQTGCRFVHLIRDSNPLHTEGDLVPGALTVAKSLLPLEVIFDQLGILSVRTKFTRPARYGLEMVNQFYVQPNSGGQAQIRIMTFQTDQVVAETEVRGKVLSDGAPIGSSVSDHSVQHISRFLDCLHADSSVFFNRRGSKCLAYPKAYLASLPSGEMVRQLKGDGGMLNALILEFPKGQDIPITDEQEPEVVIEGRRIRRTFQRVITRIWNGISTFCHASALVNQSVPSPVGV